MFVCIAGIKGNMGSRYRAILDHLKVRYYGYDDGEMVIKEGTTHIIVATPSANRFEVLDAIFSYLDLLAMSEEDRSKLYILCEKPVWKNKSDGYCTKGIVVSNGFKDRFFMVNQYNYLPKHYIDGGPTYYNYFKTGNDGIWDFIQLYHLASDVITCERTSPVWDCIINGQRINLSDMDQAYVDMIKDFLGERRNLWGFDDIQEAHRKVSDAR